MSKQKQGDQDAVYIRMELNKGDVSDSKAQAYYRESIEHFRNAGKRLANVRNECRQKGHAYYRNWLGWLKDNDIKQQRASECITLAEGWEKLPQGGSFGFKEALRLISGTLVAEKAGAKSSTQTARPVTGESLETQSDDTAPEESALDDLPPEDESGVTKAADQTLPVDNGLREVWPRDLEGPEVVAWITKLKRENGFLGTREMLVRLLYEAAREYPEPPRSRLPVDHVRTMFLSGALPDYALSTLKRTLLDADGDYRMVDTNTDVYRPDGSLLFGFRKNVISLDRVPGILDDVEKCAQEAGFTRKSAAAGQENFRSGTYGWMKGKSTSQTNVDSRRYRRMQRFVRHMDRAFQQLLPEVYRQHLAAIAGVPENLRFRDTLFTTVQCNWHDDERGYVARMGCHPDENNVPGAFGLLTPFGDYIGGFLVFPKYDICVDLRPGDLLVSDNSELHGNTGIWGRRLSVVAFAHSSNRA